MTQHERKRERLRAVENFVRACGTKPFWGNQLAVEIGVCRRSIYRYLDTLRAQGHRIEGENRLGYMARMLPETQP